MTPIMRHARFVTIFLGTVAFGQMCIAGTWYDDFSDRTLEDWGRPGQFKDDRYSVGVNKGRFNFRGKREIANLSLGNWKLGEIHDFSLKLKFMYRRIEVPVESSWEIVYMVENKDTGEWEADLSFGFSHALGFLVEPGVVFIFIYGPPTEEHPQFGLIGGNLARARFRYEDEVWYTLKIEKDGNRYMFWIEDFGLEIFEDSVPKGRILLHFVGRFNLWLDDFTVTGPTVPDGGPGFPRAILPAEKLTTTWGKLKMRE